MEVWTAKHEVTASFILGAHQPLHRAMRESALSKIECVLIKNNGDGS